MFYTFIQTLLATQLKRLTLGLSILILFSLIFFYILFVVLFRSTFIATINSPPSLVSFNAYLVFSIIQHTTNPPIPPSFQHFVFRSYKLHWFVGCCAFLMEFL